MSKVAYVRCPLCNQSRPAKSFMRWFSRGLVAKTWLFTQDLTGGGRGKGRITLLDKFSPKELKGHEFYGWIFNTLLERIVGVMEYLYQEGLLTSYETVKFRIANSYTMLSQYLTDHPCKDIEVCRDKARTQDGGISEISFGEGFLYGETAAKDKGITEVE